MKTARDIFLGLVLLIGFGGGIFWAYSAKQQSNAEIIQGLQECVLSTWPGKWDVLTTKITYTMTQGDDAHYGFKMDVLRRDCGILGRIEGVWHQKEDRVFYDDTDLLYSDEPDFPRHLYH